MANRKGGYYDEDDYDDGFYDDDYYDDDDVPAAPKPKPALKATSAAAKATTTRTTVTGPQAQHAAALRAAPFPAAPAPAAAAGGAPPFNFSTPSPDDLVQQKRQGRAGPRAAPPAGARAPTPGEPAAAAGMAALRLADAEPTAPPSASSTAAVTAASTSSKASGGKASGGGGGGGGGEAPSIASAALPQRPLGEYVPEPEVRRACLAAAEAEARGAEGAKPRLHLVVLGHVDAGKSTLMGRLLYELGYIDGKAAHKNARESAAAGKGSFAWAWVLDERPEERARGVTVDVAQARFETRRRAVTLLDAPGHRDFVPNMIAGAAQADAALLVVDGSPGGFEAGFEEAPSGWGAGAGGGQTREHAQLARSLGVEQLAVVVSKLDVAGDGAARFESIRAQLLPFLKSCGFREGALQWLPAVGPTGGNLTRPPAEDSALASWWRGPTLVEAIDAFEPPQRAMGLPLRLPVADVFKAQRGGLAVGGKLEAGAVRVGGAVCVMPGGALATVKGIEVDGSAAQLARAGDAADLVLSGIDANALAAGSVLCDPHWRVPMVERLTARVVVLDVAAPLLRGQQVTIHAHTSREAGHVTALLSLLNPKSGELLRANPRLLLKGQAAVVEVTPARPMCLERYQDIRSLGRLALREGGRTLAVGIVVDVHPAS